MKHRKGLLPLLALILLAGCGSVETTDLPQMDIPQTEVVEDVVVPEPEPEPEPVTVHILGAGDNLIHTGIYLQAGQRGTDGGYDFGYAYENVADFIAAADFASLNQECVMADMAPSSYPRFNAPQELAGEMVDIGFDLINLSNNHMFDKGEQGLLDTMDLLAEQENLLVTGAYYDEEDYLDIPTADVEGITFAFVSATQHTNGLSIPSSSPLVTPLIMDDGGAVSENEAVQALIAQVERAAQISDVVVANIHWGNEYTHTPTSYQTQVAELLVEAGVDILYGHHPHVIQPITYITRTDGTQGIVCYSLGNFISCQDQGARMVGGLMDVAVTQNPDGSIALGEVLFTPVITHYGSNYANVTNYLYEDYTDELAASHGVRTNTPSFSIDYIDDMITSVIDQAFLGENFS